MFCIIYDVAAEDARSAPPLCSKTGIGSRLDDFIMLMSHTLTVGELSQSPTEANM